MKYRKKPVVIEAVRWNGKYNEPTEWPDWFRDAMGVHMKPLNDGALLIETLEGNHRGDIGDYIIKGVKGELYPCKPDIFAATYDEA